ncbi:hypothetical protein JCM3775_001987 [Rhodotorula graminis]
MAPPTSLAELRALKRTELQALCKDNNIKAGGKNEYLINQLASKFALGDTATASPSTSTTTSKTPQSTVDKGKKAVAPSPVAALDTAEASSLENISLPSALHSLSVQVTSLKAELERQSASLDELKRAAPVEPVTMGAVEGLVKRKIEAFEHDRRDEVTDLLKERDDRISLLFSSLHEQDELVLNLADNLDELEKAAVPKCAKCEQLEAALDTLRRDVCSRLDRLEARPAPHPVATSTPAFVEAPPTSSRTVPMASPALSDAPPTRSLVSFLTPTGSPSTPAFALDSPLIAQRQSVGARKGTPFKAGALAHEDEPVTAVPSHMLAAVASAGRLSQRGTPFRMPDDDDAASPAPVAAALGKHARSSILVGAERTDCAGRQSLAPAFGTSFAAEASVNSNDGFHTAPVSVQEPAGEVGVGASAREGDMRLSKRVRVSSACSSGSIVDNGEPEDSTTGEGEDDEEPVDSFAREEDERDPDAQSEADAEVRDYLVATKTGDSPSTARKPAAAKSAPHSPAVSIHDPSFFASAASSPGPRTTLTPTRRTSTFSFTFGPGDENVPGSSALSTSATAAASTSRKSLPLAALPFPIVSPFRAAPSHATSARKGTSGTSASAKKATMASFFGGSATANRSSAAGASLFGASAAPSAFASASKPRGRAGTLSLGGGSSSSSSSAIGKLSTPLAPRTLFGTEGGGEGRFGEAEGEEEEVASPAKGGWRWERGAFGAVGTL